MTVLNGYRKRDHSGTGPVNTLSLGVLEAPTVIGAHERFAFVGYRCALMGANSGEKQVTFFAADQVIVLFAQRDELGEFSERRFESKVKLGFLLYRHC